MVPEGAPSPGVEETLLWDGLPPAVTRSLAQPLDLGISSQREGRAGMIYNYLEGHAVIDQANRIFGYGGWGYGLVGDVTLRRTESVDPRSGEVRVHHGYSAPVRVTVVGAQPRTDIGFHPVVDETSDGHETAIKAAVTDGMKRALRSFGVQFGNGFYGDESQVTSAVQPERVPPKLRRNRSNPIQPPMRTPRPRCCGSGSWSWVRPRASTRSRSGKP